MGEQFIRKKEDGYRHVPRCPGAFDVADTASRVGGRVAGYTKICPEQPD